MLLSILRGPQVFQPLAVMCFYPREVLIVIKIIMELSDLLQGCSNKSDTVMI